MGLGRNNVDVARSELLKRPELVALPRVGIAAAMAVFLVVRDVSAPGVAHPAYVRLVAALVVGLLAVSGMIHMLTAVWDKRRVAFLALGGAAVLAFTVLAGLGPRFYLLALFWIVAEVTLLVGYPIVLGVWAAMSAGFVLSELWSAPSQEALSASSASVKVMASIAVVLVGGSLTAAAWAVRAAQRERAVSDQLRELDDIKNSFLQAVSHELRTPLASILGYSLLLERNQDKLSHETREMALSELAFSSRKLNRLVVDLLDVDRLSRGIVEPNLTPTDLAGLVRRVVQETPVGDRQVHVDLAPGIVKVDAPKVERIVENLVANAAKYTPEDSSISVRTETGNGGVTIIVEDSGPGVPDELKRSIFGAFERGAAEKLHSPGVGIGLSLVSRFADMHGGRAWVQDRLPQGASFRVFLPAAPVAAAAELTPQSPHATA
ncbi:MAG: sensor histidine kinase [Actinomycetota bacterium]